MKVLSESAEENTCLHNDDEPAARTRKLGRMARGESASRAAKRIRLQVVARWDPVVLVDAKPGQSSDPTPTAGESCI